MKALAKRKSALARAIDLLLVLGGVWLLMDGHPAGLLMLSMGMLLLAGAFRPGWLSGAEDVAPERRRRRALVWAAVGVAYLGVAVLIIAARAPEVSLVPQIIWSTIHASVGALVLGIAYKFATHRRVQRTHTPRP